MALLAAVAITCAAAALPDLAHGDITRIMGKAESGAQLFVSIGRDTSAVITSGKDTVTLDAGHRKYSGGHIIYGGNGDLLIVREGPGGGYAAKAYLDLDGPRQRMAFDAHAYTPSKVVTYDYDRLPPIGNKTVPEKAITDALNSWERLNPDLAFQRDTESPNIMITWDMLPVWLSASAGELFGYDVFFQYHGFWKPEADGDGELRIVLGDLDCEGDYEIANRLQMTETMQHEIGHALGLLHHVDPGHLMYGSGDILSEDPFNTLNYTIPEAEKFERATLDLEIMNSYGKIFAKNDLYRKATQVLPEREGAPPFCEDSERLLGLDIERNCDSTVPYSTPSKCERMIALNYLEMCEISLPIYENVLEQYGTYEAMEEEVSEKYSHLKC